MTSKINKCRLLALGTFLMCMFVIATALGACSPTPESEKVPTSEQQKELSTPEQKTEDTNQLPDTGESADKPKEAETKTSEKNDPKDSKTSESSETAQENVKTEAVSETEETTEENTSAKTDTDVNTKAESNETPPADENARKSTTATSPDTTPSTQAVWGEGLDCVSCHTKIADTLENSSCLVSLHTTIECTTCHADAALTDVHASVSADDRMPSSLRASSIDTAICESCHAPETLIEKTADSSVLTDDNGTVVNPHELPDVADHTEVTCVSCHKMHSKTGVEKSASRACQSCHHTNVYECGTCHAA